MLTALRALLRTPSVTDALRQELNNAVERYQRAETAWEADEELPGLLVAATRLAAHMESTVSLQVSDTACKCSAEEGTARQ